ncbi:hypothetical protein FIBSPDRAFT_902979 [Athelia psychrophila]|uniref:DUF6532 domain-containing protein n=1 Tax=Athelia psychrophila TaxID=1759441 RepID=A0A167WK56_9AGAM|nr:hypothetical protein FIBSPDRAFT_902979 [Fibularhizoctonia sp. CBS 109695]
MSDSENIPAAAANQEKAETEFKKLAKQLKQMKKALKASNSQVGPEDAIREFESEEEDEEEISSFPKSVRHIETTITPPRGLVPASRRRPAVTATPDNNSSDSQGFGSPTTYGTTSPQSPRSMELEPYDEPSLILTGENELPQVAGWCSGVPPGGVGACACGYTDEVYQLIRKACVRYEIFIVTEQAFPEADEQTQAARAFFNEACEDTGCNYQVTDRITGIIKARGSRIRGVVKSMVRLMITQSYGFNPNPSGDVGKGRNKRQADRYLEDDRFHCLYPDDREFCFEHPLIFDIFEHIFFSNKKLSIGVAFADHFNPLPLPTMALIVAAIAFCLRAYQADGVIGNQQFSEATVQPLYDSYLVGLEEWSAIEPVVTEKIRRKQFKKALCGAGASVQKVTGMSKEAKLRARANLVGREVDTASESEGEHRAQSEEL